MPWYVATRDRDTSEDEQDSLRAHAVGRHVRMHLWVATRFLCSSNTSVVGSHCSTSQSNMLLTIRVTAVVDATIDGVLSQ